MKHPRRAITREIRTRKPRHPGGETEELETSTWPEAAIRVEGCMSRPAVTIRSDALIGAAWKLMRTRKIRHLPVVAEQGNLVGIVTDRDLRQVIFDPTIQEELGNLPRALNLLTVREIMTWGVVTVHPRTEIRQAARIMREQKIGALPVVEGNKVVGILTERDVIKTFLDVLGEGVISRPARWRYGLA